MPPATWFMDAAARGGGTPAGTAKVITQGIMAQQAIQRPDWTKGKAEKEICEIVAQSICEAVEASFVVKDYVDAERAKGRDFDEIYSEVQPYLDYVSRPIDEDDNQEIAEVPMAAAAAASPARRDAPPPSFGEEAARREARKAAAPHRNLRAYPAPPER
ncbi:unnamed protein product [Polarella glacialis]|uniref:Uncharacterized protein n=1 Tax=Polarella glacialis TaxID=89957 RepID=A0A813FCR8_POLGL|nr:unnamed protein product [Polarella glacialis]